MSCPFWLCFQLSSSWVSFGQHPLGPSWLELVRVGLDLIKLKLSPKSSQDFHHLANSSQVVFLLLGDCAVAVRQLNGFLDLAVPFYHPPMQVLILKLGSSWLELGRNNIRTNANSSTSTHGRSPTWYGYYGYTTPQALAIIPIVFK